MEDKFLLLKTSTGKEYKLKKVNFFGKEKVLEKIYKIVEDDDKDDVNWLHAVDLYKKEKERGFIDSNIVKKYNLDPNLDLKNEDCDDTEDYKDIRLEDLYYEQIQENSRNYYLDIENEALYDWQEKNITDNLKSLDYWHKNGRKPKDEECIIYMSDSIEDYIKNNFYKEYCFVEDTIPMDKKEIEYFSIKDEFKTAWQWLAQDRRKGGAPLIGVPPLRNGQKATANVIPDTKSRGYICIENGIEANWGGYYARKGKYSASHSFTKIISYAKYRGWDEITIQALIWKNLDQVRLNSKYQNLYNQYSNELKKDPNSNKFKGATVYEYRSPTRPNTQHLIAYSYTKPNTEITLKKWERDKKIYTGGNVTKAITQAKGNYSLSGAQYGIYKTQADAKAKRNLYKTVTLSGDNPAQAKFTLPANSTYYGREIKAPAKGYYINDEVFTISTHSGNKTIHVTEIPKTDPMRIVINKTDIKGNGLEGAKFEVRYYNQMLTKAQAENATSTKRWIYKSDKYGKVELNNKAQKIGGDTLYIKIKNTFYNILKNSLMHYRICFLNSY